MKFFTITFLITAFSIQAQDINSDQEKHAGHGKGKRRPPKVAIEACQNKQAGAVCEFQGKKGEQLSGTCFRPKEDVPFACKPSK